MVGNADLVDSAISTCNLSGDFRLEAKSALFDGNRLNDLPPEYLVASLHVIGAKVVSHGRYVIFQMAEVAIARQMFQEILRLIAELRPQPPPALV
jgi:hypothetical protein